VLGGEQREMTIMFQRCPPASPPFPSRSSHDPQGLTEADEPAFPDTSYQTAILGQEGQPSTSIWAMPSWLSGIAPLDDKEHQLNAMRGRARICWSGSRGLNEVRQA